MITLTELDARIARLNERLAAHMPPGPRDATAAEINLATLEIYTLARLALSGESWRVVPVEPTQLMWDGLARDIVMWDRFHDRSGAMLYQHLRNLGRSIPDWLRKEIPDNDHVPPKGTVAVCIYRAMIANAPSPIPVPRVPHTDETKNGAR